jgi:hypothetical protein
MIGHGAWVAVAGVTFSSASAGCPRDAQDEIPKSKTKTKIKTKTRNPEKKKVTPGRNDR